MHIRFGDHASFHRAAAGMALGSLLAGIASHFATGGSAIAPLLGGLAGVAAGAAWGYGRPIWRLAAAVVAAIPLLTMTLQWPALALSAAALGLGVAAGKAARPWAAVALAAAAALAALLLARWCSLRVDTAQRTQSWPGFWTDGAAAAAMGIVAALAVLPRHLALVIDPVQAALKRLPAALDPEVRRLCERSAEIWSGAKARLADGDPGRDLVRDGVLKTLEVAVKSAGIGAIEPVGAGEALAARMADLDQRIAAATDAEVKAQYTAARAALEDQRRYREHIANGRERLVARMHNHIAALEKFQLAATGLSAARAAASGATAVTQLAELSSDVAASGDALAELELGEPVGALARSPAPAAGADEPAPAAADIAPAAAG